MKLFMCDVCLSNGTLKEAKYQHTKKERPYTIKTHVCTEHKEEFKGKTFEQVKLFLTNLREMRKQND
jgi:uncharacterized protein YlaI